MQHAKKKVPVLYLIETKIERWYLMEMISQAAVLLSWKGMSEGGHDQDL